VNFRCLCLSAVFLRLLSAQALSVPWSSYGHDPQHTGISATASQSLNRIKWQTPVDQVLQGSTGQLLIHYGSPMVTAANSVIVPVRTSSNNTFQVEVRNGSNGALKYSPLTTDYSSPPHNWIPPFPAVVSARNRLYYAGAGGTVYYRDTPDSATGASGQIAFYGLSNYTANQAAFNADVMISTPITSDRYGDIFFGFVVTGGNPGALNLQSGIARIDATGHGSWVSAVAASGGDSNIVEVSTNCTPALSTDQFTLYFAVSRGSFQAGYLTSVDSRSLAPIAHVALLDPEFGNSATLPDDGSASPMVGPDGDVYYGVFEQACCTNHDRGWMLHFDKTLAQKKIPGAFGWDDTASVVTSKLVPSYQGTSAYLILTKYNNYKDTGGNGQNRVAILDPNASEVDPITGATVMKEVITILGVTADGPPTGAVREWCINSAAIDPFTKSAIINSEDGVVYRWDFTTNSFTQQVTLTAGVAEAYTPTVIGVDGTSYAINDAVLFAVGQ
jgi:hypothetical protein